MSYEIHAPGKVAELQAQLAAVTAQRDELLRVLRHIAENCVDRDARNDAADAVVDCNAAMEEPIARAQSGQPARDWPEDAAHENGQYQCICAICKHGFVGHKRRVLCFECALGKPASGGGTAP